MTAFVVVRGREDTDGVYAVVDAASPEAVVQVPRYAAAGWWLIEADLAPRGEETLRERLVSSTALLILGDSEDGATLCAFEPGEPPAEIFIGGSVPVPGFAPDAGSDPRFADWLRRFTPRRVGVKAQQKLWAEVAGAKGLEVAEAVLRRLGFKYAGRGPVAFCEGCTAPMTGISNYVAETYMFWGSVRWFLGHGEDESGTWFGLWDLDAPGQAVRRWPATPEGARSARQAQFELIGRPMEEQCVLDGIRRWTPLVTDRAPAPAAFYHYSPDRRLSVTFAGDPPRTYLASRQPGFSPSLGVAITRALGISTDYALQFHSQIPLPDAAEAERVAWGIVHRMIDARWGIDPSPWRDIPDTVERGYLPTAAWVLGQVR